MMTAHGLGAFVGWAGFAVMGLSYWVLAGVGFPVRGFGLVMARLTWWLMVLGVAGVIVTTLFMGFGASWVFLYPLPFYGAGNWGDWATGLFSFSVLLAGLAIVTWCFAILHTVTNREALHSVSSSIGKRLGLSFGWGFLMPRTFATNPKPVPYPVIPLAVIGLDMIIATLPLAGLLIWQILQSMHVRRRGERAAREEHPLVVRPPGRLSPALPRRGRLLLADPALRRAATSSRAT